MPQADPTDAQVIWKATGLEKPIFLDERGHRRRIVRVAGAFATLLVTAWLAFVIAGPFGFASLPRLHANFPVHIRARPLVHHLHVPVAAHHRLQRETQRS